MSDHDPLERMSRFGSDFEGLPAPLPAAEVRRRGDRLRRRSTTLRTGVATLAVAAIAVPLGATLGHGDRDHHVADRSTDVTGVTAANVLADDQTVDDAGVWKRESSAAGDGQAAFNPCARSSLAGLGASSVYGRSWSQAPARPARMDWLGEMVAEFPTGSAATAAYQRIGQWVHRCSSQIAGQSGSGYAVAGGEEGGSSSGATTLLLRSSWSVQPGSTARRMETGLVLSARRIAVLTWVHDGATASTSLVQQMLTPATERLELGATPGDAPSAPTSPAAPVDALAPFGYQQIGGEVNPRLRLGEGFDRAVGSGLVVGSAARGFRLAEHRDAEVCLTRKGGVMAVFSGAGLRTPEGIGKGSTYADLTSAYPGLQPRSQHGAGVYTVALGGHRFYEIDVEEDDTVSLVIVKLARQTCFE